MRMIVYPCTAESPGNVASRPSGLSYSYEKRLGSAYDQAQRDVFSVLSLNPLAARSAVVGSRSDSDDDDDVDDVPTASALNLNFGAAHADLVWRARQALDEDLGLTRFLGGPDSPDRNADGTFKTDQNERKTLLDNGEVE